MDDHTKQPDLHKCRDLELARLKSSVRHQANVCAMAPLGGSLQAIRGHAVAAGRRVGSLFLRRRNTQTPNASGESKTGDVDQYSTGADMARKSRRRSRTLRKRMRSAPQEGGRVLTPTAASGRFLLAGSADIEADAGSASTDVNISREDLLSTTSRPQKVQGFYMMQLESTNTYSLNHKFVDVPGTPNQIRIILQDTPSVTYFAHYEVYYTRIPTRRNLALMAFRLVGYCDSPDKVSSKLYTSSNSKYWLCSDNALFRQIPSSEQDVLNDFNFVWLAELTSPTQDLSELLSGSRWPFRLATDIDKVIQFLVPRDVQEPAISYMDIASTSSKARADSIVLYRQFDQHVIKLLSQ